MQERHRRQLVRTDDIQVTRDTYRCDIIQLVTAGVETDRKSVHSRDEWLVT